MLGFCRSNKDYQIFVLAELGKLAQSRPDQIREYTDAISKMLILNLDPLVSVIKELYPPWGRPAHMQPEIFRSFVLMMHLKIPLNNWVVKLVHNPVLRVIAGFSVENMPKTSSYYDFIDRIVPLDEKPVLRRFCTKPKKKLKKGEKMPPRNPGVVSKIVNKIISGDKRFQKRLGSRPERFLQKIFARVSVDSSAGLGLLAEDFSASGDGTCIAAGASHYGEKVCMCKENGIYKCTCDRKYSDPSANWGWDSQKEKYFFGYSGYFISSYNRDLKLDLPLHLRLVQASRHDSVSAVFALAEFKELNPGLRMNTFISDSASDNQATYELLDHWGIDAVIALNEKNKGNNTYPAPLRIDENGTPICPAGQKMHYYGFCSDRCRFKWRCPRVMRGLEPCDACGSCSASPYGRVVYTKAEWDLRLFTRIPRGTDAWKEKMKERTASERVNDRIMNDYGIENRPARGKKRISFLVTLAAVNIHLDAQLKVLTQRGQFDFDILVPLGEAA